MARGNGATLDYSDQFPTGPGLENPFKVPSTIDLRDDKQSPVSTESDGTIKIERPDGSVTIDFNPQKPAIQTDQGPGGRFDRNLAEDMDDRELMTVAGELNEAIEADEQSRKEWMDIRTKGLRMLALQLEEAKTSGDEMGPMVSIGVEGQSTVRHTLMLEAVVAFQAGCRAELLPASGPAKIQNSGPPSPPTMGDPVGAAPLDDLANAFESDFNYYLTDTARDDVPDTDRMFFKVAFEGDGFKKLYHCPLRRRPVSESIDSEHLIVSNSATDLASCGRITHRIKMRRSILRRMQLIGAYMDIDLPQYPQSKPINEVEQQKAEIYGYSPEPSRPKDADFEVDECYAELDLERFAPRHLRGEGLPLSYKVSIERTSRKILEVRRNWRQDDRECNPKLRFVQYPFILGIGFYGLGFVHLLGNSVQCLTAAYRLMLDAGEYANFPAFIYDKQLGRQLTNQFRAPKGGGVPLDLPANRKLADVVMAMPYHEVGPSFTAFIQHVEDRTKQLAMVSNASVGEGKQDAPVGTTLALLEQATKVEGSAFKRLHQAQAEEFRIFKELFREDPEAIWRHAKGKNPSGYKWQKQQFAEAVEKYELQPVADPNNPTSLHRMMKAAMLKMLAMQNPQAYNMIAVDKRIMSMANIDPAGIFAPPAPPAQDPTMMILQAKAELEKLKIQLKMQEQQLKAAQIIQDAQGKQADRAHKERIEQMKAQIQATNDQQDIVLERLKMNMEAMMHVHQTMQDEHAQRQGEREFGLKQQQHGHQAQMDKQQAGHQQGMDKMQFGHQQQMDQRKQQTADMGFAADQIDRVAQHSLTARDQGARQQQASHQQTMDMGEQQDRRRQAQHQQGMDRAQFGHQQRTDAAAHAVKIAQASQPPAGQARGGKARGKAK